MAEAPLPIPPDGDVIQGPRYMAAVITLTIISVLVVWLRMYVRIFVSRNVGWDDHIMFSASLIALVTNTFLILAYYYGVGRHLLYVEKYFPQNIPRVFMWLWAAEPTNLFAVYLVRLSICLFFIRLVQPKKIYLWVIWITIAALTASNALTSVYYFFECRPIRKVWILKTEGSCFGVGVQHAAIWLYQATSILGDLILLCIPVTLFWRLQVPLGTKVGLIVICSLGIFTNICAIVKTVLLPTLFSTNPDKTWIIKDLCLWARIELCVGIICGTIPALAPLFSLGTKFSLSRQRRYTKFGHTNSYELSPSHSRGGAAAGSILGAQGMMRGKGNQTATIRGPTPLEEKILQSRGYAGKVREGIRATYEVEVSSEVLNHALPTVKRKEGRHGQRWNLM